MIKKIISWVIALSIIAVCVYAVGNIHISPASDAETANVGDTVSKVVTISNSHAMNPLTVTMPSSVEFIGSKSNRTLAVSYNKTNPLYVANASSVDVNYMFTVPSDALADSYNAVFNFTNSTSNYIEFPFTLDVNPSYSIQVGDTNLGNINQGAAVSKTVKITNNGNAELNNIILVKNIASKYNATMNQTTPFNLGVSESSNIMFNFYVPSEDSPGSKSLGTIDVVADEKNFTGALSFTASIEGKLLIEDLDVIISKDADGKRVSSTNLNDGDKIDEKPVPGAEVEFSFKLRNSFSSSSDIEITDIVTTVTIKDIDQGDDIEVESDEIDIDADDSKRVSVVLDIPKLVEEKSYDVEIHVEGEDDNGATQELDWSLELTIDKETHSVVIDKASLGSETLKCSRQTGLDIELINYGSKDEDEIKLEVKNAGLGINFVERDIELPPSVEEDDIYEQTVNINLKNDVAAGTYPITIKAYYSDDILDDIKTVNLIVEDCTPTKPVTTPPKEEEKEEEKEEVVVVETEKEAGPTPEIILTDIPNAEEEIISVEKPFTQSPLYVALLLIANLIIVAGVLFAIARMAMAK